MIKEFTKFRVSFFEFEASFDVFCRLQQQSYVMVLSLNALMLLSWNVGNLGIIPNESIYRTIQIILYTYQIVTILNTISILDI